MSVPSYRRPGSTALTRWDPLRWDPFADLRELNERMSRLAEQATVPAAAAGLLTPATDVIETDDAWIIETELPGVDPDNVTIEMSDNELVIRGEIMERERRGIFRRQGRRTGTFEYRVSVAGDVDVDNIQAVMTNGLLTVSIPKPQPTRPKRVEIQQAAAGQEAATSKTVSRESAPAGSSQAQEKAQ
jgi:HSP20 family protein